MLSPVFIALLIITAYTSAPWILKHRKGLYIGVWGLLIAIIALSAKPFTAPFTKGYIGFAFFYVVMITGALNPTWALTRKLKSVRAPYSIMGFVLLLAHPLSYATEILSGSREFPIIGVLAFAVMIPLFITSYMTIRKRMKPANWFRLQKWAYLSYALILIHLIVNASSLPNRIVAIVLFIPYIVLKLHLTFKPEAGLASGSPTSRRGCNE